MKLSNEEVDKSNDSVGHKMHPAKSSDSNLQLKGKERLSGSQHLSSRRNSHLSYRSSYLGKAVSKGYLNSSRDAGDGFGSSENTGRVRDSMRSMRSIHRNSGIMIDKPTISLYPRRSILRSKDSPLCILESRASEHSRSSHGSASTTPTGVKPASSISLKKYIENATAEIQAIEETLAIPQYNEYLMLQYRHSSSNYIHQVDSEDIIWESKASIVKMLGQHLMGGRIGKGAFGKVKEGVCADNLQRIAIKIISKKRVKKMVDSIVRFPRLIREIKLLRMFKHKNIVRLVDVYAKVEDSESQTLIFPWFLTIEEEPIVWIFEDGKEAEKNVSILKWFIVLEYCPCSLQTILDHSPENKIPEIECHDYYIQLMNGLSYIHSQSVVHRDIKPGNLLLTNDGVLKITDFGTSEVLQTNQQFDMFSGGPMLCKNFAGTHHFIAPEVIRDDSETGYDGTKVDIWAAGVVLYYMISGKLPFEYSAEPNVLELHEKILNGNYQTPKEATISCANLIMNVLQCNPDTRYTIDQILNHYWTLSDIVRKPQKSTELLAYQYSTPAIKFNSNTDGVGSDKGAAEESAEYVIPCETTMIPYLQELHQEDLTETLQKVGYTKSWLENEEEEAPPPVTFINQESPTKSKNKLSLWINRKVKGLA